MSPEHEQLLHPDYLAGIADRPIDEIRAMRTACVDAETGLSYLRRMVQGPLDLVSHQLSQRASGQGSAGLAEIVASLPTTLADQGRPAGVGRLAQTLDPHDLDLELEAELNELVGDGATARLGEISGLELVELAERLRTFEAKVSDRRRLFFATIDTLQAELTRRYQSGEASVDALLQG